jgi:hypothetical protein
MELALDGRKAPGATGKLVEPLKGDGVLKATVENINFHDGDDFPYFTAGVDIGEDIDTLPADAVRPSVHVSVFIDRDDSLPLNEIKRRAVAEAYRFLSLVAASRPA